MKLKSYISVWGTFDFLFSIFLEQAKASEQYPCPYTITAMMTVWASTLGVVFALCTEKDWSNWILGWNIRLLTIAVAVGLILQES